jgi:hypothetical protein
MSSDAPEMEDLRPYLFIGGPLDGHFRQINSSTFHLSTNEMDYPTYSKRKLLKMVEEWNEHGHIVYAMAARVFIFDGAPMPDAEYIAGRLDRTHWYEIPGSRQQRLPVEIQIQEERC